MGAPRSGIGEVLTVQSGNSDKTIDFPERRVSSPGPVFYLVVLVLGLFGGVNLLRYFIAPVGSQSILPEIFYGINFLIVFTSVIIGLYGLVGLLKAWNREDDRRDVPVDPTRPEWPVLMQLDQQIEAGLVRSLLEREDVRFTVEEENVGGYGTLIPFHHLVKVNPDDYDRARKLILETPYADRLAPPTPVSRDR